MTIFFITIVSSNFNLTKYIPGLKLDTSIVLIGLDSEKICLPTTSKTAIELAFELDFIFKVSDAGLGKTDTIGASESIYPKVLS